MEAGVRLENELKNLKKSRCFGFYARPHRRDIFSWTAQIHCKGYFFLLIMKFTKKYPITPPQVVFKNRVYHPNVYSNNQICLDILSHKWCPSMTVNDILHGLARLLEYPNPDSPANGDAATLYKHDRAAYDAKVEECNRKNHAKYAFIKE